MGYRVKFRRFHLVFTDLEMAGCEIMMRSLPVGRFLELARLADSVSADDAEAVLGIVAGGLISWNLEDDEDKPIPADIDGVKALDSSFFKILVTEWMRGMAAVDPTLLNGSSSSGIPPEVSLELESLSQNLASLQTPG